MSYALAAPLQSAVFDALITDVELDGMVGSAVFDAEPTGVLPSVYITLGPELVKTRDDGSAPGAIHEFLVSVVTDEAGFAGAKTIAGRISDVLVDAELVLSRGKLVSCRLIKGKAVRVDAGARRRIDLTFRARVDEG